jgi:putative tryptophan/tyrosine transport system substrate-binding protein
MNRRLFLRAASRLALGAIGALPLSRAWPQDALVAVVYPELAEPYRTIFAQMLQGVREVAGAGVVPLSLGADVEASGLAAYLRQSGIKKVIVLGRQAIKAASTLSPDVQVVLGGAVLAPSAETKLASAISLTPDADQLFAMLRQLAPEVRRVFTVFSAVQNGWLIELARAIARQRGMELVAAQAQDLRSAAREHARYLEALDPKHDGIWLLQDANTVDDSVVLPLVLRLAWDRQLVVFSSSLPHVKKGALFALYPDNVGLGRELAELMQTPTPGVVHPARRLKRALNTRTAAHLGLPAQRSAFDAIFPEQ